MKSLELTVIKHIDKHNSDFSMYSLGYKIPHTTSAIRITYFFEDEDAASNALANGQYVELPQPVLIPE